jgi:hypothetical protein
MKNHLTSTLLAGFFFLLSIGKTSVAQKETGGEMCSRSKIQGGLILPDGINITPHNPFNIIHYMLDFDLYDNFITPYPRTFNALEVVTFRVDTTLNSIHLDAVNTSLGIDSVGLSAISFTHADNVLNIQLDNTYQPNDIVDIKNFIII